MDQAREELRKSVRQLIRELQELEACLYPGVVGLEEPQPPPAPRKARKNHEGPIQRAILRAMKNGAHTPEQIAGSSRLKRQQIYNAVHMLLANKKLKRTSKIGKYALVE